MEAKQKRKLEDQLRKLMAKVDQLPEEKEPAQTKTGKIRVIRRRRGEPDLLIA